MLVEEDFQMAKKQIHKKPSSSFVDKVNNEHAKSFYSALQKEIISDAPTLASEDTTLAEKQKPTANVLQ